MAHANRSKTTRSEASNPTPAEVRAARERAPRRYVVPGDTGTGLTKQEAAGVIHGSLRAWENWETDGDENRRMHPGLFELFQIKTGQSRKYRPTDKE